MSSPDVGLVELREHALRDLSEIERQVEAGEIDADTAGRLRLFYEEDAARAIAALAREGKPQEPERAPRNQRRAWRLAAALSAAVLAVGMVGFLVRRAVVQRPPGGYVSGIEVGTGQAGAGRDLSTVSNEELEAVVVANPDIVPMRLALAHRYFDAGDYKKAFDHYRKVLDREPDPEALSHVGWIVFQSGENGTAARLLEESLKRRPDDPEALWFLANVRYYGFDDRVGAVDLLDRFLAVPGIPAEPRRQAEELRDLARSQPGGR